MSRRDDESWGKYWSSGSLTSCADAFAGNYEGVMRSVWEARFADLEDGATVLDICTGNGAIALIAAAAAKRAGRHFRIEAIDRAAIFPERAVDEQSRGLLAEIHFQSGVDASQLPFDDASIDLITGQFALEYTELPATIADLARVATPGGGAFFVLHHDNSVILRTAAEERRHIALILDETGLFERASELLGIMGRVAPGERAKLSGDPAAERARTALNTAASRVSDALRAARHPEILRTTLGYIGRAWETLGSQGAEAALASLASSRAEIAANAGRLEDLTSAALSPTAIEQVASLFTAQGLSAEIGQLVDERRRLIGWTLGAKKPA